MRADLSTLGFDGGIMSTKNKTIILIIALALLPVVAVACLCVFAFALPAQYSETFLGELKYKIVRLEETPGKRIVVIGGSSVAFGQDGALIQKYLPEYTAVDFGLYGDLGTKIMLDIAEDEIRKDDIVIISPEQDAQTLSTFFSGETFWQAADGDFSLLGKLKSENIGGVIGAFPRFAAKKAAYCVSGAPQPDDIYSRASFNEYGDIKSGLRPYNIMPDGYDSTRPVSLDIAIVENEFTEYLNEFADKAARRGASVYYRLCPINKLAVSEEQESAVDEFYDRMSERLNFPMLGDPRNSIMDHGYFYDSNFHLNDSGVILNTKNIIRDIKLVLGDTSATNINVPNPPVPPTEITDGDNSDEDMFVYERQGRTYRITGLSEDGKQRTRLTVPVRHNGARVSGFAPTAFSGATKLEELTLQENIGIIEDNSFEGCTAFKKLILLHSAPNKIIPGEDIVGSSDFGIYVPQKLLHRYRVNYFWAQYATRIFAAEEE